MKRGVVIAFVLFALVSSVRGRPISIDNLWINLALSVAFFWIIIRWLLGRRRRAPRPRLSTPTIYGGITFRSKTEAAWAKRFDRDGLQWRYEEQWFRLQRNGRRLGYLPDFEMGDGTFVEIKGTAPTEEECWKCQELARITGREVQLLAGWPGKHRAYHFEPGADG